MCVHEEQPLARQGGQAPVECRGVRDNRSDILFERDEDAGLLRLAGGAYQRLQRKYALARARPAHDERGAVARKSAELISSNPCMPVGAFDRGCPAPLFTAIADAPVPC